MCNGDVQQHQVKPGRESHGEGLLFGRPCFSPPVQVGCCPRLPTRKLWHPPADLHNFHVLCSAQHDHTLSVLLPHAKPLPIAKRRQSCSVLRQWTWLLFLMVHLRASSAALVIPSQAER